MDLHRVDRFQKVIVGSLGQASDRLAHLVRPGEQDERGDRRRPSETGDQPGLPVAGLANPDHRDVELLAGRPLESDRRVRGRDLKPESAQRGLGLSDLGRIVDEQDLLPFGQHQDLPATKSGFPVRVVCHFDVLESTDHYVGLADRKAMPSTDFVRPPHYPPFASRN